MGAYRCWLCSKGKLKHLQEARGIRKGAFGFQAVNKMIHCSLAVLVSEEARRTGIQQHFHHDAIACTAGGSQRGYRVIPLKEQDM